MTQVWYRFQMPDELRAVPESAVRALYEHVTVDGEQGLHFRDVSGERLQYPWHFHPELELTHIVQGSGLRYVSNSVEPFADGDLCLIGGNTPHCWLSHEASREGVRVQVIQFLPSALAPSFESNLALRPLHRLFERARRGLHIEAGARERTIEALRVLFTERVRPLDRYAGLLTLLADLSESSELRDLALSEQPASDEAAATIATRLTAFVRAHAADPELCFERTARALGMSRATLGRAFPRLFGMTFVKYLAEVRVERACTLLDTSSASISEIAIDTGFGSASNFNRHFTALKKTTPLRYRKAVRDRDRPR